MKKTILLLSLIVSTAMTSPVVAEEGGGSCYPITVADLVKRDAPAFEAYPAKPQQVKAPKLNIQSHREARFFKKELRQGAAKGPNFAGHYTVAGWSCGASCLEFAVVDARSGKVIFPDDIGMVTGLHVDAREFEDSAAGPFSGLRYKRDSRLLIVVGTLDEDPKREGAFYYVLEKDKLKRVYSVNVKKGDCDTE